MDMFEAPDVQVKHVPGGVRAHKHDGVRLVLRDRPSTPRRASGQVNELKAKILRLEAELAECHAVADRLRRKFGELAAGLADVRGRLPANFCAKKRPTLLAELDQWVQFAAANETDTGDTS